MNYKEIIQNVLKNGQPKQPVRFDIDDKIIPVENNCISTFCEIFTHDMSEGFPLSSLRPMPFFSTCVELEGFIKGITDKKWYEKRGCKFWSLWANPIRVNTEHGNLKKNSVLFKKLQKMGVSEDEIKLEIQKDVPDLGPIYGHQWRNFSGDYKDQYIWNEDPYSGEGYDQFKSIVGQLKTNPYSRRMVCSSWNPNQQHMMALPPCHFSFTVNVIGDKLNLAFDQRSCDLLVNQTITTYGLMILLLCKETGLKPGMLNGRFIDCHIYDNQIETAKELVSREEKDLPQVTIDPENLTFNIFWWDSKTTLISGYDPHPKVDLGTITV